MKKGKNNLFFIFIHHPHHQHHHHFQYLHHYCQCHCQCHCCLNPQKGLVSLTMTPFSFSTFLVALLKNREMMSAYSMNIIFDVINWMVILHLNDSALALKYQGHNVRPRYSKFSILLDLLVTPDHLYGVIMSNDMVVFYCNPSTLLEASSC